MVAASLDATATGRVFSDSAVTGNHYFDSSGTYFQTSAVSGSKFGVGDIAVRVKYNLGSSVKAGAALLADIRLPPAASRTFWDRGAFPPMLLLSRRRRSADSDLMPMLASPFEPRRVRTVRCSAPLDSIRW